MKPIAEGVTRQSSLWFHPSIDSQTTDMVKRCVWSTALENQDVDIIKIVVIPSVDIGLAMVQETLRDVPLSRLVVILAQHPRDHQDYWQLLRIGAEDVLVLADEGWEVSLKSRIERWLSIEAEVVKQEIHQQLIGSTHHMVQLKRKMVELSLHSDAHILVTGESGTGKEVVARLIHDIDDQNCPFVTLDCTTIVAELSGSEFFGHEAGSFTGAQAEREGAFSRADGGYLFLDEIGDLPLPLQAELLRVIQEKTYKRVGSNAWRYSNFRLICATHRNLKHMVEEGRFRADLYYRIADSVVTMPALRERKQDIPELVQYFITARYGKQSPTIVPSVTTFLYNRPYKGNIRELKQVVNDILIRYPGTGSITPGCLAGIITNDDDGRTEPPPAGQTLNVADNAKEYNQSVATIVNKLVTSALHEQTTIEQLKSLVIQKAYDHALELCTGDTSEAARTLGCSVRSVQMHRKQREQQADLDMALPA